jgi:hypothetical protein
VYPSRARPVAATLRRHLFFPLRPRLACHPERSEGSAFSWLPHFHHGHFERSKPIFSSPFAPAKGSACVERNLSSLRLGAWFARHPEHSEGSAFSSLFQFLLSSFCFLVLHFYFLLCLPSSPHRFPDGSAAPHELQNVAPDTHALPQAVQKKPGLAAGCATLPAAG